jgi:hypothetical protein
MMIDYKMVDQLYPGQELKVKNDFVIHRYLEDDMIVLIKESSNKILCSIEKNDNHSLIFNYGQV